MDRGLVGTGRRAVEPADAAALAYQTGFGNEFASEALPGALPVGQNSPQHVPYGLYAELVSGSAFVAPRAENRRSWLYRRHPSADHGPFRPLAHAGFDTLAAPAAPDPNRLRWDPLDVAGGDGDFVDGLVAWATNGDVRTLAGATVYLYRAARPMTGRAFFDADGELLIVPQAGALRLDTELGRLDVAPGQIAVVPRGLRFRVGHDGPARGYVCENRGAAFRLPELGPIGSNGLANPRDFEAPVAWADPAGGPTEIVQKFADRLWTTTIDRSPFDVVAWHGSLAPYRYDLARFAAVNSVTFDHPDPSIFTVLTSPGEVAGTPNVDFVVFPERWSVAEHTFRPPWYHRNVMSEFMGLIEGVYEAKAHGFLPGGVSIHNTMSAHGPDRDSYAAAIAAELAPRKISDMLAFMFESRWPWQPTAAALAAPTRQDDYDACWAGLGPAAA